MDTSPVMPAAEELPQPTRREREVLQSLVEGHASDEIATALFVSKRTVDFHLRNLYEKYRLNNRTSLALLAVERGWAIYHGYRPGGKRVAEPHPEIDT